MNGNCLNEKTFNFEKTYPGCLGRMLNLYELNTGVSANKLLTDKPHRDGSPLSRSRSDVSRMSPSHDQVEDKVIVSEFRDTFSNKNSNTTPMKMLIAKEMSKEVDSRRSPPNLVAKLMGLDSLPQQELKSPMQRSHSGGHPRSHSDIPRSYWEQQNGFCNHVEPNEQHNDVYEIWQQSQKSTHRGIYKEAKNDEKMAFVRQKFIEAKRLSIDGKLRQSKQFQDALEVLNSNKDLFLECLQEPNSIFSQHLHNLQSIPPHADTKRITVLKPSKIIDGNNFAGVWNKNGKEMNKSALVQQNGLEKSPASWKNYENATQPTRIVVLKPTPGKPHDDLAIDSPHVESPRIVHSQDFFADVEDDENHDSREAAKAITKKMRKKLGRLHRDEALISSVFSNGYVGDESSFHKSEIEYSNGNISDSEVNSPASRHSWDYVNRVASPYSSSSFSRASYSPESPVCREAKKRLSERWAMVASNGTCQEQRHTGRSSSTLGEMLALSETKKVALKEGSSNEEPNNLNSLLMNEPRKDEIVDDSPGNLTRSKSVPVSSTQFGVAPTAENSVSSNGKLETNVATKTRSVKSSLKGKVSSLFFSRNKKINKDRSVTSENKDEGSSNRTDGDKRADDLPSGLQEPFSKASFSNLIGKQDTIPPETGFSAENPIASRNPGENYDRPSPIFVLHLPFEEDEHTAKRFPHSAQPDQHGFGVPLNDIRSNLVGKSPPIGSISRTLSWEDSSCLDTASSSYPIKDSSTHSEEQEWFFFVKTLLSVAGLGGEVKSNSLLTKCHSPESPLDPSLRDTYIDLKDKEMLHEAKRRQKRSTRKLVFDCVNAVLVDIVGYSPDCSKRAVPCIESNTIVDEVWARMNAWFCGECVLDDENSLVVERVVRKEVVGNGWNGNLTLEIDNLGKEIEGKLLEELVQETLVELTGNV